MTEQANNLFQRTAKTAAAEEPVLGRAAPEKHTLGDLKADQERPTDTIITARPRVGELPTHLPTDPSGPWAGCGAVSPPIGIPMAFKNDRLIKVTFDGIFKNTIGGTIWASY